MNTTVDSAGQLNEIQTSSETPKEAAGPITAAERILTLDVLRGFALFGIMFVNVHAMVHPDAWFDIAWSTLSAGDYGFEAFKILFTQGKFYTLFAFLFGLGFAVQLDRAEKKGVRFAGRFFWRILLLWFIGVTHMILIWDGDILNTYAVGGLFLLFFFGCKRGLDRLVRRFSKKRDKLPRWTALVVSFLLIFGLFGGGYFAFQGQIAAVEDLKARAVAGEELSEEEQERYDRIVHRESEAGRAEQAEQRAETRAVYTDGSYLDTVEFRAGRFANRAISGPFWLVIAGIFILGAYFGRNNFIGRAAELKGGFKKLLWISLIAGLPLTSLFLYVNILSEHETGFSILRFAGFFLKTASGLAFALFFVAAITLGMLGSAQRWLKWFAPVGRMALTNYIMQSIIGTFFFYGWGLGMMEHFNNGLELVYMITIFAFQTWFSIWWLERYRFGPLEWLWRSGTYLKWQPIRKAAVTA